MKQGKHYDLIALEPVVQDKANKGKTPLAIFKYLLKQVPIAGDSILLNCALRPFNASNITKTNLVRLHTYIFPEESRKQHRAWARAFLTPK